MKKLLLLLAGCSVLYGQQSFNKLRIIPNAGHTTAGEIDFYDPAFDHYVGLAAPVLTANLVFKLPAADGSMGQCMTTDGSKNLSFNNCNNLTPPVVITGSLSGIVFQAVNNGTGVAIQANSNGGIAVFASNGGSGTSLEVFGSFTGTTLVEKIVDTGNSPGISLFNSTSTFAANWSAGPTAAFDVLLNNASTHAFTVLQTGSLQGSHIQNVGTGDAPTFGGGWIVTTNGQMSAAGALKAISLNVIGPGLSAGPLIDVGQASQPVSIEADADNTQTRLFTVATNASSGSCTTGPCKRWSMGSDNANETGSNQGSNWILERYNDIGGALSAVIQVARATGLVTFNNDVTIPAGSFSDTETLNSGAVTTIVNNGTAGALQANSNGGLAVFASNGGSGTSLEVFGSSSGTTMITKLLDAGASVGISLFNNGGTFTSDWQSGATAAFDVLLNNGTTHAFTVLQSGGGLSGSHIQNLGTSDSPTFSTITVSSCSGCGTAPVSSVSAGANAGLTVTPTTGAVIVNLSQGLATSSSPTFSGLTVNTGTTSLNGLVSLGNTLTIQTAGGIAIPGFTVIDHSANLFGNSLTLTGISTNSGGDMVCVTSGGLLYKTSTTC